MPRTISNPVHRYFTYNADDDKSECNVCGIQLRGKHATNLKYHMLSKHHYREKEADTYEYVVGSPKSMDSKDSGEDSDSYFPITKKEPREPKSPVPEPLRRNHKGKLTQKRLLERLTEEKINITAMQKELVEKELEEKNLRVQLLQEEIERKKEMHELEKQEMLLKIEVLKANLKKNES